MAEERLHAFAIQLADSRLAEEAIRKMVDRESSWAHRAKLLNGQTHAYDASARLLADLRLLKWTVRADNCGIELQSPPHPRLKAKSPNAVAESKAAIRKELSPALAQQFADPLTPGVSGGSPICCGSRPSALIRTAAVPRPDRQDLTANHALLSRHHTKVQFAALELANGLVAEGNLPAERSLARAGGDAKEPRVQIGDKIRRSRMWTCRAKDSRRGPGKVGPDREPVAKAVAGQRKRPAPFNRTRIARALPGSAQRGCEWYWDGGLLQGRGKKRVLDPVSGAANL